MWVKYSTILYIKRMLSIHIIGLCEGNSLGTIGFPSQKASNAKMFSVVLAEHVADCYSSSRVVVDFSKTPWRSCDDILMYSLLPCVHSVYIPR